MGDQLHQEEEEVELLTPLVPRTHKRKRCMCMQSIHHFIEYRAVTRTNGACTDMQPQVKTLRNVKGVLIEQSKAQKHVQPDKGWPINK